MSNDNPKSPKKPQLSSQTRKLLEEMGIDPDQLQRESLHELMIPKMALVGIFNNIQKFASAAQLNIQKAIGPLDVQNLKTLNQILTGNISMAERVIKDYELLRRRIQAKDTLDQALKTPAKLALPPLQDHQHETPKNENQEEEVDLAPLSEEEILQYKKSLEKDLQLDLEEKEEKEAAVKDGSGFGGSLKNFKNKGKLAN